MLSHLIVSAYKGIIEIGLGVMLVIGSIVGYTIGATFGNGTAGLILGGVTTFFFLAILFGAALILADIHSMLKQLMVEYFNPSQRANKSPSKKQLAELGIVWDGQFYYVRECKFTDVDAAIERAKILAVQRGTG